MGVSFNLASVTMPNDPSEPVIKRLISKVCKSSLSTCSRSYPVKKRFNLGNLANTASRSFSAIAKTVLYK